MIENKGQFINIHTHKSEDTGNVFIMNMLPGELLLPDHNPGLRFSVGIHPWYLKDVELQINNLIKLLPDKKVVAIGECGLDVYSDFTMELQQEIFRAQIELSERHQKPLIIHCVRAFNEIIKLRKQIHPKMPWILHGFNANEEITKECIRQGLRFSLGHHLMEQESHAFRLAKIIPDSLIFFETDESNYSISDIYKQYGEITGMKIDTVKELVINNFNVIFQ